MIALKAHLAPFCLLVAFALATSACGRPFDIETPDGFVELEDQKPAFDYRATSVSGVVIAAKAIDSKDRNDVEFWKDAIASRLRTVEGYSLLSEAAVTSVDGTPGHRLRFGRDEQGQPYEYWVTVFTAQDRIFVIEAGGSRQAFDGARKPVERYLASVRVRCDSLVAPVLASRTCNRW